MSTAYTKNSDKWHSVALTLVLAVFILLAGYVLSHAAEAPADPKVIDVASCDPIEAIAGFTAEANGKSQDPVVELSSIKEDESMGSGPKAQKAVQAYNTVFGTEYAADGILVMHVIPSDNYLVGVIVGNKACAAKKMSADEFSAFSKLISDPTA